METKTVDTTLGALNYDSNSAVANCMVLLNTIPTGTSAITRVGKAVNMIGIQLRFQILAASATITQHCATLLIYVRNNNQAASLPAVADILVSQSANSLTNRDNSSKFKILRRWDDVITGNSTTPATGNECIVHDEYVKLNYLPAQWTAASTAGTIGEFEKGSLLLLTVGTGANGATTTPTLASSSCTRAYFKDA